MSYNVVESRYLLGGHSIRSCCGICAPQKCYRWSFLSSSMGNALVLVCLSLIEILLSKHSEGDEKLVLTFDIIIIFLGVSSAWFAFHGIVFEYQYEMYLYFTSMLIALIFCWLDFMFNPLVEYQHMRLIRNIVISSLTIPCFLFCLCVSCSENWTEFYIVGISEEFLNMYKKRRYLLCLLKFDMQLVIIIGIFAVNYILSKKYDFIILSIIILYAVSFWILISFGIRHEKQLPLFIFVFGSVALPIWITYEFTTNNCLDKMCTDMQKMFKSCNLAMGILVLTVRLYVLTQLMKVYRNFGCGLSDTAFRYLISPESSSLLRRPRTGSL